MITGPDMYRRAIGVVHGLERRVRAGEATDADRARYRAGVDHVLIYDWAQDDRPAEVMPPLPELPRWRSKNRTVLRFCNWWARVHTTDQWQALDFAPRPWRIGLLYWWHPLGLETLTEALECEVEAELVARGLIEPDDVLTDPFQWFDHEQDDAA